MMEITLMVMVVTLTVQSSLTISVKTKVLQVNVINQSVVMVYVKALRNVMMVIISMVMVAISSAALNLVSNVSRVITNPYLNAGVSVEMV